MGVVCQRGPSELGLEKRPSLPSRRSFWVSLLTYMTEYMTPDWVVHLRSKHYRLRFLARGYRDQHCQVLLGYPMDPDRLEVNSLEGSGG